jgi:predicted nuclease of predicted toxin-antitoxin system
MVAQPNHDAAHVRELGMRSALDPDIWRRAIQDGRILITKDADFAYLALSGAPGPQVVWIRCGNLKLAPYQQWLEARWPSIEALFMDSERLVEAR